jgi:hypothetical protein
MLVCRARLAEDLELSEDMTKKYKKAINEEVQHVLLKLNTNPFQCFVLQVNPMCVMAICHPADRDLYLQGCRGTGRWRGWELQPRA